MAYCLGGNAKPLRLRSCVESKMKTVLFTRVLFAGAFVTCAFNNALAQQKESLGELAAPHIDHLEEVHVLSSPLNQTQQDSALAITLLKDEALRNAAGGSLGETLSQQVGVHSASFGAGVGQPVVRGQTGNRVAVLQNGIAELDAANASPDHANSVEPLVAKRIEVIRGPATLLYGNGAIGGVVNVVDNRIPEQMLENSVALEARYNSVNDLNSQVVVVEHRVGSVNFHMDASRRRAGLMDIPVEAESEALHALHEAEEEHDEDEHEEHEEHEDGEHLDANDGVLANSQLKDWSANFGASWVLDNGFVGLSYGKVQKQYGLPLGTHIHAEHDEEDEGADEAEHHEDVEKVRIAMQTERWEFKTQWDVTSRFLHQLEASATYTQYKHQELEYFEHHDEEDNAAEQEVEVGTEYNRSGTQVKVIARQQSLTLFDGNLTGAWGLQFANASMQAQGEEAFIPHTTLRTGALFVVQQLTHNNWVWEAGLRAEDLQLSPDACKERNKTFSASGSVVRQLNNNSNLSASYSVSQRAPASEERYSNIDITTCQLKADPETWVAHGATAQYELMATGLDNETAHNAELRWRKHTGDIKAEVTFYHSNVNNYVYLARTGEEFEGVPIAQFEQADAYFQGWEAEVTLPLLDWPASHWDVSLFTDGVRAKLQNGENLPRIPPLRFGGQLNWHSDNWATRLRATQVAKQNKLAAFELESPSYVLVDLNMDYHFHLQLAKKEYEAAVFFKASNLLNEEIRHHTSYVKDVAPAAGRAGLIGLRMSF